MIIYTRISKFDLSMTVCIKKTPTFLASYGVKKEKRNKKRRNQSEGARRALKPPLLRELPLVAIRYVLINNLI